VIQTQPESIATAFTQPDKDVPVVRGRLHHPVAGTLGHRVYEVERFSQGTGHFEDARMRDDPDEPGPTPPFSDGVDCGGQTNQLLEEP